MGVHVCCCRSKARMTPCSLVRKKADVQPGVSITLPNSKTISSGMALWQWVSPVSAVGVSHSAQLQDNFIRYGFMADIHQFQLWLSAQIQDYFIRHGFLYCRHSPVSAVGLSLSAQIQDSFVTYGFMTDIQLWVSNFKTFIRYDFTADTHRF